MGEKITITRLCELTGQARPTVTKRLQDIPPVEKKGNWTYYDAHEALPALYQAGGRGKHDADGTTLTKEKARLTAAQREKAEIELDLLKGTVIDAEAAGATLLACITEARSKLLGVPRKLATEIDPAVEARAEELIHEVLDELATTEIDRLIHGSVEESAEADGESVVGRE